jgi:hypothetical protein
VGDHPAIEATPITTTAAEVPLPSLGLGAAIANGEPALNSIEVERGPVLYCALEDTGRRLTRLRR